MAPLVNLPVAETLANLPAPWPVSPMTEIDALLRADDRALVVLDDDPTGTQTVHGIAVLTTWGADELEAELRSAARCFFVLTNSRSLPEPQARALATQIGANLRTAVQRTGRDVAVVSRSDSTLRGHFPAEVDALSAALGAELDAVVLAPWFLDGGRITLLGVHYARTGETYVPVGHTEFARDASFGYENSRLADWIAEKTGGAVRAGDVTHFDLPLLRAEGPDGVAAALRQRPAGGYVSFDAVDETDVAVVVAGLLAAEASGRRYLYRTGASFVRVRAGIEAQPLLLRREVEAGDSAGRLLVVGSHVARSTEQLNQVLALPDVTAVELRVDALGTDLRDRAGSAEIQRCTAQLDRSLSEGRDTVLYTSRALRLGDDPAASLVLASAVSDAVVACVAGLATTPRLLVAKGGITSSDIATKALGVRRAMVVGQIQAGVPVWELGSESRFPGMRYVVFPGNVGTAQSLAELFADEHAG